MQTAWVKTSHCSWDRGAERIVRLFCPRMGGVIYRRFNGKSIENFKTLEGAQHG